MIPKIIHYCWFGGKPKPKEVLQYIETWKKHLPEFKIMEWNESNFSYEKFKFTYEAYKVKKYAYVSDVCRLHALYNYGGLYFDTDIEVVGPFDKYLNLSSFVGFEVAGLLGTGVIGAEKNAKWIKIFLDQYNKREFVSKYGVMNLEPNTKILTELMPQIPKDDRPSIFPVDVFCAKNWKTHEVMQTEETVSIHHYRASWEGTNIIPLEQKEISICNALHFRNFHIISRLYKYYLKIGYALKLK